MKNQQINSLCCTAWDLKFDCSFKLHYELSKQIQSENV